MYKVIDEHGHVCDMYDTELDHYYVGYKVSAAYPKSGSVYVLQLALYYYCCYALDLALDYHEQAPTDSEHVYVAKGDEYEIAKVSPACSLFMP